jgi:hypothetical protein
LKPAKNTRPHHGGGRPGKFNQFNKKSVSTNLAHY